MNALLLIIIISFDVEKHYPFYVYEFVSKKYPR